MNQFLGAQPFVAAVTPLLAHALVQALGEGFGQTVGQGFGHNRVVIVIFRAEAVAEVFQTDAAGDRESAEVIGQAGLFRGDEIGQ